MSIVQGIGGVFLYSADAGKLAEWYTEYLGIEFQNWGKTRGVVLPGVDVDASERVSNTTFSIFQADGDLPEVKTARINYRVSDIAAVEQKLVAAGHPVIFESNEADGKFRHFKDPEGNVVELWQPPLQKDWPY